CVGAGAPTRPAERGSAVSGERCSPARTGASGPTWAVATPIPPIPPPQPQVGATQTTNRCVRLPSLYESQCLYSRWVKICALTFEFLVWSTLLALHPASSPSAPSHSG